MKYLYTLLLISSSMVSASQYNYKSEIIEALAKKYQCIPGAPKRVKLSNVTLNKNNANGIMFWCKVKKYNYKLLVSTTSEQHPWANCSENINNKTSMHPLNLKLISNNSVSAEYDSGGYLFACTNNKWKIEHSH